MSIRRSVRRQATTSGLPGGPLTSVEQLVSQLHALGVRPAGVLMVHASLRSVGPRLGADRDTLTLTHLAEYRANVPGKRRVRLRYIRADTGDQWIDSLDDTDGITDDPTYFVDVLTDYLASGRARTGPVGGGTAELLEALDFMDFAVPWLERRLAR